MFWSTFKANQRLSELEEELSKLKRMVEDRDLDWQDMRARCRRLLDRTEKAADRISEESPPENALEVTEPNGTGLAGLVHHALTPRQRAVQAMVLKQRQGGR
jgi:predicted nuclease with TOPRIM domain